MELTTAGFILIDDEIKVVLYSPKFNTLVFDNEDGCYFEILEDVGELEPETPTSEDAEFFREEILSGDKIGVVMFRDATLYIDDENNARLTKDNETISTFDIDLNVEADYLYDCDDEDEEDEEDEE